MKTYSISSGPIKSEIILPRSKSYANRLLILSALSKTETVLSHLPDVDDVIFLTEALRKIGIKIIKKEHSHYILGNFPNCVTSNSPIQLDVGEGGTTARFLAALLALDHHEYHLHLSGKLSQRPWKELIETLKALKVKIHLQDDILSIKGPVEFTDEKLIISAKRSTQFASALALAFSTHVEVIPKELLSSVSYWKLTEDLIQNFKTQNHFNIPIDWSGASYPLCFAALNQETRFPGLKVDLHQADSKLFDILNQLGGIKSIDEEGITICPIKQNIKDLNINVEDCLDLVPALAYLLSHIDGSHTLTGVSNLVHKESDRLSEIRKLLKLFDRETVYHQHNDTLSILGHQNRKEESVSVITEPDHRLVMTASLFLKHHSGGNLAHPEAVQKSFAQYFQVCGI